MSKKQENTIQKDLLELITTHSPWGKIKHAIWLCSELSISRNVENFLFPHKLGEGKKVQLEKLLHQAIQKIKEIKNPRFLPADKLSLKEHNLLNEHFLLFDTIYEYTKGQSIVIDQSGSFLARMLLEDHIQLNYLDVSHNLEKGWKKLTEYEKALGKEVQFAFSSQFGFLTANPLHCGTALKVVSYLHLPVLIETHALEEFQDSSMSLLYTGFLGNPEEYIGDILSVRNAYTLGVNEETILSSVRKGIQKLVLGEKNKREEVKAGKHPQVVDKIARALGELQYARQLNTVEALQSLSFLKLGLELGYVQGMTLQEVNHLFFTSRGAHLMLQSKKEMHTDEVQIERASLLREKVKKLKVTF